VVHIATVVKEWMAAKTFRVIEHPPPHTLDLATADFFLFSTIKKQLACKTMTQERFKVKRQGAVRSIAKGDFATAFPRGYEQCDKRMHIGSRYKES
jgi:hypothetical protein